VLGGTTRISVMVGSIRKECGTPGNGISIEKEKCWAREEWEKKKGSPRGGFLARTTKSRRSGGKDWKSVGGGRPFFGQTRE